ncbi:hypothetical protein [Mycobacteroides chelonae]|uniref:hypothetical protein n=1 Tax=Mycobacteroides chelonae TaxID=1774 RepID=UPI0012FFAD7C|nr:hypothetical protein [Mycobacteroides chelonae]
MVTVLLPLALALTYCTGALTTGDVIRTLRASAAVLKSVTWLAVWVCEVGVRASESLESFPWHAVPADVP